MDLSRFQPSPRSLGAFAVGGAWFFIVVSLLHVLWAIAVMWGDPSGTTKLYHSVVGDVSYDAWCLTYTGVFGLVFAILQLLVVSGAAVATTLPFDRTLKVRRAGHLVLVGWAGLWALNLVRLVFIDARLDTLAQAVMLSVLFVCTVWRASSGWSPGRSSDSSASSPTPDPPGGRPLWDDPQPRPGPAQAPNAPDTPDTPDAPHAPGAPGDADNESFSALVAAALNKLVRFVRAAVQWVLGAAPRLRNGGRVVRRKAAGGLHRVADFTHKQASRVAPNTGK